MHGVERTGRGLAAAPATDQSTRIVDALAGTEAEHDSAFLACRNVDRDPQGGTRIERCSDTSGQRGCRIRERVRCRQRTAPADEVATIGASAAIVALDIEEGGAAGEVGVVGVSREQRAGAVVDRGDDLHRRLGPLVAEHPLDVTGHGQLPRLVGRVAQRERRELHRRVDRDMDAQRGRDPVPRCARSCCSRIRAGPRTARRCASAAASATRTCRTSRRECRTPRCRDRSPGRWTTALDAIRGRSRSRWWHCRSRTPACRTRRSRSRSSRAPASCGRPTPSSRTRDDPRRSRRGR